MSKRRCQSGGIDELTMFKADRLATHDARHVEPVDRPDRDENEKDRLRSKTTISNMITRKMNGSAYSASTARIMIASTFPPTKACCRAVKNAEHQADDAGHNRNEAGVPANTEHVFLQGQVATQLIGAKKAHPLQRRRRCSRVVEIGINVVVRNQQRSDQRDEPDQHQENHAGGNGAARTHLPPDRREGGRYAHRSRILGSRNPYSRSTSRFRTMTSDA